MTQRTAPYGAWESPITAAKIALTDTAIRDLYHDQENLYWLERRPSEGGRNVIVRRAADGSVSDLLPAGYDARTLVHEYGGADYMAAAGTVYFSNFADQRLYRLEGTTIAPVTPAGARRYADVVVDDRRQRLIAVSEDHAAPGEAVNSLVAIDPVAMTVTELTGGYDFYAAPRLSPDGRQLAWICWRHPDMPWDGTELWLADVTAGGALANARRLAGDRQTSLTQPWWSPDGQLYFISDASGWWNLYRWGGAGAPAQIIPLCPRAAEFSNAPWKFGISTYDFFDAKTIICTYSEGGYWYLARLCLSTGELTLLLAEPYANIRDIQVLDDQVFFIGEQTTTPAAVIQIDLVSGKAATIFQERNDPAFADHFSIPETITFPTTEGEAYGFYYAPRNPAFAAPAGARPPLIVMSHGGPTGTTDARFDPAIQYWTSRGFAVLDVNYRGSTGYGRAYRQKLNGRWGVADVEDCINGARYLVNQGLVDPDRLAIRGGSAGGYTTLCAITFHDFFHAGASHFGVSELAMLLEETHKFESRYLESVVGPFSAALYHERSPLPFADQITCPVIFFQGLEDPVVPPNQSELMYKAVKAKGIPTAFVGYPGERHGFRMAENIQHSLESELYFYGRVFGFEPAGDIAPIVIDNLD